MKSIVLCLMAIIALTPGMAQAQGSRPSEFQLTKITKDLITPPVFAYNGGPPYRTNQNLRWLQVEAEFTALPEYTDELTLKYYILLAGNLLTGEVTHVGILAGKENRSVAYVSPKGLERCLGSQPMTINLVQNIGVQILQKGTVKDELTLVRAPAQWYSAFTALPGLILNKNETPYAPLFWDRYEQIKPATR